MDFLFYKPTILIWIILGGLAVVLLVQLIYYFCIFGKLIFNKKKTTLTMTVADEDLPPVSVVIATKNEEYYLKDKLAFFLEQDYPEFEVIVVNDASTDESEYILKAFSKIYPNLKVVNIVENVNKFRGKKFPISLGIKSAKYEHLVLSCADCEPCGFNWLRNIASHFDSKHEIVLGFGSFAKRKGIFNALLQYDNVTTAMNYIGLAQSGQAYRGDCKNIAYTKELFYSVGGFTKHYNITLGEDDIFVKDIATSKNVTVAMEPESFVSSSSKRTFKDWKGEKKNRIATFKQYKSSTKFLLNLLPITTFLFYAIVITLAALSFPYQYLILALLLKFIPQTIIYFKACKRLETKRISIFAPLFEIYFLFFNAKLRIASIFTKS